VDDGETEVHCTVHPALAISIGTAAAAYTLIAMVPAERKWNGGRLVSVDELPHWMLPAATLTKCRQ